MTRLSKPALETVLEAQSRYMVYTNRPRFFSKELTKGTRFYGVPLAWWARHMRAELAEHIGELRKAMEMIDGE